LIFNQIYYAKCLVLRITNYPYVLNVLYQFTYDKIALEILHFKRCYSLKFIPSEFIDLITLNCAGCPLITELPQTLTYIPKTFVNLKFLNCPGCPLLYIPMKFRRLTKAKSASNFLRIRIFQRKAKRSFYNKIINESALYAVKSVITDYLL
jgi:hypothetical protein